MAEQKNYNVIGYADKMKHSDWEAMRVNSIGGSEVAAAMGLNPFMTKLELWGRKTGNIKAPVQQTDAMYWGNRLQSIIADEFMLRHKDDGYKVIETKAIFQHKSFDYLTANIDGYVDLGINQHGEHEYAVLEVKTTAAWNADSWNDSAKGANATIPLPYYLQAMFYMTLLNGYDGTKTYGKIRKAFLVCLVGGNTYKEVEINYDEEIAAVILYKCAEFWQTVVTNTPPAPTASDNDVLNLLYPTSKDIGIILPEDKFASKLEAYSALKEQAGVIKSQLAEIESEIKATMKEAGCASCGKDWSISYKSSMRTGFDSEIAKSLLNEEDVAKCVKQTNVRTLRITRKKAKVSQSK